MVLYHNTLTMLKRLFSITLFALFATVAFSQNPRPVKMKSPDASNLPDGVVACTGTQLAGTVSLGTFTGSSNDVNLDVMYLCIDDEIEIVHNGDFNLSGDPVPGTPGGIGYAFYECAPTVTGDELLDITTMDMCTYQNPIFMSPLGNLPIGPNNIWVAATPGSNGINIINTGGLQDGFNNGNPVQFWYAPITYDALDPLGVAVYEGVPSGSCVNVNTNAEFSVVYLNKINFSNMISSYDAGGSPSDCGGTFTISGGLPEFDPMATYNFNITRVGNPSDIGQVVTGSATNGETVEFKINVPGTYNISVTDGKGCPADTTINISGCPAITLDVGDETALNGTQVCVPVTVTDFVDISSFQFTVEWDPAILQFSSANAVELNQTDLFANSPSAGVLTLSYFDLFGNPITLNDGDIGFELCFNVLGPGGAISPISITESVTPFDVNTGLVGLISNNGSVTVTNSSTFDIGITHTDETCFGEDDGSFTVAINGTGNGTAPYNITWSEVGNAANNGTLGSLANNGIATQSNLPPGEYALVTTDSGMPSETQLDTVTIIAAPNTGVSIDFQLPTCAGGTDGVVSAIFSIGGFPVTDYTGYSFVWNPDPNGATADPQSFMNYIPGQDYAVTITEPNGCTRNALASGTSPLPLDIDFAVTDASCSGINNGAITATPSGGPIMTTYTYAWSTAPVQTTPTISNLALGAYTLTITDGGGCTYEESVLVGAATEIFSGATIQDVTCNGADNGSISFLPQVNGINNGGYTYQWSPAVSGTSNANGLEPITYDVTITDALGCNIDTSIIISEPDLLEIVGPITVTDETCAMGGNDGTATATVTGGTPLMGGGYTFNWSSSPGQTGDMATGIPAGNYTLEVTDANTCMVSTSYIINPPMPPAIVSFDSISVSCPTDMDGSLTVNAIQGNAPISNYNWTFPSGAIASGQTINNIGAGTYTVTVVATDGCEATGTVSLFAPQQLMLIQPQPINPTCFGLADGTAAVEMSGGTMPYGYQWSANANGSTDPVVPLLGAGTYTVTVTDANNCDQVIAQVVLEDPSEIDIAVTDVNQTSCFNVLTNCDGGATVLAAGGVSATYTYIWSSGETTTNSTTGSTATQLCAGIATVTAIDANNCSTTIEIDIPEPPELTLSATLTEPTCNGDTDGSILGMGMGGTASYDYLWEGGTTGELLDGIGEGIYDVTVTDMNGCILETQVQLGEPDELVAFIDSTENITCSGDADGFIRVDFSGGNGGSMTYTWSANAGVTTNSNFATGLSQGLYNVTVTDSNGCTSIAQQAISEPIEILAVISDWDDPICNGDQTTITVDTAFGGDGGPYTFSIDGGPNQNIGNLIDVFAGPHTFVVEDGSGCAWTETITINEPLPVTVDLGPDLEIQLGDSVILQVNLSSNVILDSLIWIPSILDSVCLTSNCLNPTVTPTDDILYTVEVFDVDGCNGSDQILIEVDKNRNVYIPNVFTPNGDGYNDIFNIFSGPGVSRINKVQIFDRWGEMVFERTGLMPSSELDYRNSWDGRMNGRVLNPGVFVYLIEVTFDDGVKLLYRGDLTLLH